MGGDEPVFSAFSGSATAGMGFNPAAVSSLPREDIHITLVLDSDCGGGSAPDVLSSGTISSNFLFLVVRRMVERESVKAIPLSHIVRKPAITHNSVTKTATPYAIKRFFCEYKYLVSFS